MSPPITRTRVRQRPLTDEPALSPKPRERRYRDTPEVADAVGRLIVAVGKRVATEDAEDLSILIDLDGKLREAFATAIPGQRSIGYSDTELGAALGTTMQAVQQRWPREQGDGPA